MRTGMILGLAAFFAGSTLAAQTNVQLTRSVFVERFSASGTDRSLEPADNLRKGDSIVLMVGWKSGGEASAFTVSSPLPKTLYYQRSSNDAQVVSVDGGKSWGRIGTLEIRDQAGKRLASAEDVTHLRWRISARRAARGSGRVTYSAIVR